MPAIKIVPPPKLEEKTVFIVDDHPMLRRGLAALIEGETDLSVCGEAATAEAALEVIEKSNPKPDLAILDLALAGSDGLELVKDLKERHPEIPVLVLSMHDESVYAERSIRAGARGYVTKQKLDDTVLIAIRRVLGGDLYLSEKMGARFAEKYLGGGGGGGGGGGQAVEEDSPLNALSDREIEVYRLIGRRLGTREIAERLGLSVKTIESHREHIKQKLTLADASALILSATRWVDTGEVS